MSLAWVGGLAGFVSAATVIGGFIWLLWRKGLRRLALLAEDWFGEAERKGPTGVVIAPARAGVMERLAKLEQLETLVHRMQRDVCDIRKELKPNGGSSTYDKIDKLASAAERPKVEAGGIGFQAEIA